MLPKHEKEFKNITQTLLQLATDIIDTHKTILDGFKNRDVGTLKSVKDMLKSVPDRANEVDNEMVKILALFEPEAKELRAVVAMLKITNELSRIAVDGKKYAKSIKNEIDNKDFDFNYLENHITQLHLATIKSIEFSIESMSKDNEEFDDLYRKVMIEESKTDDLLSLIEKEILTKLTEETELLVEYVNVLSASRRLERAADHAVNIAKLVYFAKKGGKIESF